MARKRIVIELGYSDEHEIPKNGQLHRAIAIVVGSGILSFDNQGTVIETWECYVEDVPKENDEDF